jgi:hypothetical protein
MDLSDAEPTWKLLLSKESGTIEVVVDDDTGDTGGKEGNAKSALFPPVVIIAAGPTGIALEVITNANDESIETKANVVEKRQRTL